MSWFDAAWQWYSANNTVINPIGTFIAAVGAFLTAATLAWAGFQNARTAARRHEEQTRADLQRRITESFSKATEQLASEKIEARLGGIYTLERISRESPDDYRIVMETLSAFLREHTRWKEQDKTISGTLVSLYDNEESKDTPWPEPATDIAAILAVIVRRDDKRETINNWVLDLRQSNLRGAILEGAYLGGTNLTGAHLEGANLRRAHLEGANLTGAYLQRAHLWEAQLQGAFLGELVLFLGGPLSQGYRYNETGAHLERAHLANANLERAALGRANLEEADLTGAHLQEACLALANLERATLWGANLERADLRGAFLKWARLRDAHLAGARLWGAHLEGANLETAKGLVQDQITEAAGNAVTTLPPGLTRPEHWARV